MLCDYSILYNAISLQMDRTFFGERRVVYDLAK